MNVVADERRRGALYGLDRWLAMRPYPLTRRAARVGGAACGQGGRKGQTWRAS